MPTELANFVSELAIRTLKEQPHTFAVPPDSEMPAHNSELDIKFLRVAYLDGPNIWTYRPVLEAWVDIGGFEERPSNKLPGFVDRLVAWLPGLAEHRCGVGEPGGFVLRLRDGTWMGHILEHVTLELQSRIGMRTGFGKARETSRHALYKVVVRSRDEKTSRACLETARELLLAAVNDTPFDLDARIAQLRDMADRRFLGPSTACIVDAAADRGIPFIRLSEGNLVQLGYGAQSHRIWTAETDRTGAIAESICSDKDLTKQLLSACGVPVPEGRAVDSAEDAWEAAQEIGLPVVVKPADANHGRGVFVDLNSEAEVKRAYEQALIQSSTVLVERFIRGDEHRLLVVGNKVVAAARGESVWIVGDGRSTVAEIVAAQVNTDPRRGEEEEAPLDVIRFEEGSEVLFELARQGLAPESIPAEGQRVLVQRNGNVAIDVTDNVHPSVAATATLAARIVGLDIAGIDLVTESVAWPLAQQRSAIVEVNAGPGLLMHLKPAIGEPRPVGRAIVDHLFGNEADGRIPIVGVTGSKGKTTVSRLVGRMLKLSGRHVGLACGDGLFFDRRRARDGNRADHASARRVLLTRSVEAAVFENGLRTILADGLAYDRCTVGVVTNMRDDDRDAEFYIDNADQLANVYRTQVDVVLGTGVAVLNADDARVAALAPLCDGEVVFFGRDPETSPLTEHLFNGGRAVLLDGNSIMLATGASAVMLTSLGQLPMTAANAAPFQAENAMAAIAAAWSLGISQELIRAVIETFDPTRDEALDRTPAAIHA